MKFLNIKKYKLLLISLLIIFITSVSYSQNFDPYFSIEDLHNADVILSGANGNRNSMVNEYINSLCQPDIERKFGNCVVISKKYSNKCLLFGHSIVSIGYDTIKYENIDVISIAGAHIDTSYFVQKHINKKYEKAIIWLGLNDVLYCYNHQIPISDFLDIIKEKFDSINSPYFFADEVTFMCISRTYDGNINLYIDAANDFIKANYDYIEVSLFPDSNEFHYKQTTFKTIFDNQIKPRIS